MERLEDAEMDTELSPANSCDEILHANMLGELMRPLCTICHDRSSGFHYGTHACEGCKGFFRRMVTNVTLIQTMLQCTGSKKYRCTINSVTRNNCQRCRLQKCFQMGMTRHKTRLGRRTKSSSRKIEVKVNSTLIMQMLSDEEMAKCIKRESRYFSNNDSDDEEPSGKCIKHKAKLYSEKNSKCYQTYLKISSKGRSLFSEQQGYSHIKSSSKVGAPHTTFDNEDGYQEYPYKWPHENDVETTCTPKSKGSFAISDLDRGESKAVDFTQSFLSSLTPMSNIAVSLGNVSDRPKLSYKHGFNPGKVVVCCHSTIHNKRTPMFESIRINTEKLQINEMCLKIRIFLAYDLNKEDLIRLNDYKRVLSSLNRHFFSPSLEDVDRFCRIKFDSALSANNPQVIFNELKTEMIEMCKNILDFFKLVPDLELFQRITIESDIIRKKIIQTLAIWMIKFVNVPENILYDPKLSMKIPFSLLNQSPLRHFFETLFHLADISNSILASEIDDTELSFISLLIITFPKKGFIHCSENMLQSDYFSTVRFLYSALLYEYLLTEKCQQNVDNTENRFQKFCWLINQSHLLQEMDVNFMFSYMKL